MLYFTMYMLGAFTTHCWIQSMVGEKLKEEGLVIASVIAAFLWPYTLIGIHYLWIRAAWRKRRNS